jgi:hypothetical protein
MRRGLLTVLVTALAVLGTAALALAQDEPAPAPGVSAEAPAASAAPAEPVDDEKKGLESRVGALPFTGLDLILLAGIAFVITGAGWALLRLSAPRI